MCVYVFFTFIFKDLYFMYKYFIALVAFSRLLRHFSRVTKCVHPQPGYVWLTSSARKCKRCSIMSRGNRKVMQGGREGRGGEGTC